MSVVDRALDSDLAVKMKDGFKNGALASGSRAAWPLPKSQPNISSNTPFRCVPCWAAWPSRRHARAAPGAGDSGVWGGNMDFNEVIEGATVYLPVCVPGALLYVGDGHAAQGDGELNGNALETSMDVEFTVDVIPGKHIPSPRVESGTQIMAMG